MQRLLVQSGLEVFDFVLILEISGHVCHVFFHTADQARLFTKPLIIVKTPSLDRG
jgi:hypothetical protein